MWPGCVDLPGELLRQFLEAALQHLIDALDAVAVQHRRELRAAASQFTDGPIDEDIDDAQAAVVGAKQVVEQHRLAGLGHQPCFDDYAAAVGGGAFLQDLEAFAAPTIEVGGVGGDAEARERLDDPFLLLGLDGRPLGAGGDAGHGRQVEGGGHGRVQALEAAGEFQRQAVLHGGEQGVIETTDHGAGRSGLGGGRLRRRQQREHHPKAGEKWNEAGG